MLVGDSRIDHETARNAAARCCLAVYGFGTNVPAGSVERRRMDCDRPRRTRSHRRAFHGCWRVNASSLPEVAEHSSAADRPSVIRTGIATPTMVCGTAVPQPVLNPGDSVNTASRRVSANSTNCSNSTTDSSIWCEHRSQPPDATHRDVRCKQVVLAIVGFGVRVVRETCIPVKIRVAELLADRKVHLPSVSAGTEPFRRVPGSKDERQPWRERRHCFGLRQCLPPVVDVQVPESTCAADSLHSSQ